MIDTDEATCILGPEWSSDVVSVLRRAVHALGGTMTQPSHFVAGSQEIITYQLDLPDGRLVAEAETFVGLSISGPAALVHQVRSRMRA